MIRCTFFCILQKIHILTIKNSMTRVYHKTKGAVKKKSSPAQTEDDSLIYSVLAVDNFFVSYFEFERTDDIFGRSADKD